MFASHWLEIETITHHRPARCLILFEKQRSRQAIAGQKSRCGSAGHCLRPRDPQRNIHLRGTWRDRGPSGTIGSDGRARDAARLWISVLPSLGLAAATLGLPLLRIALILDLGMARMLSSTVLVRWLSDFLSSASSVTRASFWTTRYVRASCTTSPACRPISPDGKLQIVMFPDVDEARS
jgi:hypothetical protein